MAKVTIPNKNILKLLRVLFIIGLLHLSGIVYWYAYVPIYDIFMHFGTAFALSFAIEKFVNIHDFKFLWQKYFFIFSIILLLGVLWEFMEFGFDKVATYYFPSYISQMSIADTLGDLLLDMLGSVMYLVVHYFRNK